VKQAIKLFWFLQGRNCDLSHTHIYTSAHFQTYKHNTFFFINIVAMFRMSVSDVFLLCRSTFRIRKACDEVSKWADWADMKVWILFNGLLGSTRLMKLMVTYEKDHTTLLHLSTAPVFLSKFSLNKCRVKGVL